MPGFTTHYLFGVKAYNDLPNNYLKHVISKYRWLYQIGLQEMCIRDRNMPLVLILNIFQAVAVHLLPQVV